MFVTWIQDRALHMANPRFRTHMYSELKSFVINIKLEEGYMYNFMQFLLQEDGIFN